MADPSPVLPALDGGPTRLLIDGEWVPPRAGGAFDTVNPSTGEVIGRVAEGGLDDLDLAVAAARRAFEGPWSRFTPAQRQRVLLELADLVDAHRVELRQIETRDMGVPIARPFGFPLGDMLRAYASFALTIHGETLPNSLPVSMLSYTVKEPVGVVGAITAWNGPSETALWKIAPVLATGCTVVLKPPEDASLSVIRLGELIADELDLPPGVINIVTGYGETVGAALAAHPGVDKITFTGSTATGQAIMRAAAGNLKRLTLELGGKSPDIVFADADLEQAVPSAGLGVFLNSGQICVAGTRVFVERPIYEEFVERLSAFAGSLKVGDSLDPATEIGPVASLAQLKRVTGYLESGRAEGARATVGGERLLTGPLARGYFIPPTVFVGVRDDMRIAQEEIFGPVASVLPFDTVDEVVRRANDSRYGLAGGVWTRDVAKAHRVAGALHVGNVWVNSYGDLDPAVPFGGVKMSGWGRELGAQSLEDFLTTKAIWVRTEL